MRDRLSVQLRLGNIVLVAENDEQLIGTVRAIKDDVVTIALDDEDSKLIYINNPKRICRIPTEPLMTLDAVQRELMYRANLQETL